MIGAHSHSLVVRAKYCAILSPLLPYIYDMEPEEEVPVVTPEVERIEEILGELGEEEEPVDAMDPNGVEAENEG